jgi:hypothetical protein
MLLFRDSAADRAHCASRINPPLDERASTRRLLPKGGVRPSGAHDGLELAQGSGGRLSLRHQDLREGSASEALLFDDVELQVLIQLGEWAVARADRDGDR